MMIGQIRADRKQIERVTGSGKVLDLGFEPVAQRSYILPLVGLLSCLDSHSNGTHSLHWSSGEQVI